MPVRFSSDTDSFVTFRDVALQLLRLAGHSGTLPGAIPAEQVAEALSSLEAGVERVAAVEAEAEAERQDRDRDEDEDEPERIGIRQRAFPLVQLLKGAATGGSDVRFYED